MGASAPTIASPPQDHRSRQGTVLTRLQGRAAETYRDAQPRWDPGVAHSARAGRHDHNNGCLAPVDHVMHASVEPSLYSLLASIRPFRRHWVCVESAQRSAPWRRRPRFPLRVVPMPLGIFRIQITLSAAIL